MSSNERIVATEDIPTHDVQSQTELPLVADESDFAETLENDKEESNSMLVHSLPETMFHCTSSSESCQEAANKNEQSFDCCSIAVLPAPAPSSQEKPLSDQELYNSFNFWRTPLPKIDIDLELQETAETLDSETQEGEQEVVASASSNVTMATRKELEEMIENLEPHIDDPDVKGINTC